MNKKVSIILPVYNSEKYLAGCIESILDQDYNNIELIAINDGSTDGSKAICEKYASDERVKFYDKENEGVSTTRNLAIEYSTGDYIMFVDSDDTIEKNTVSHLVNALESEGVDVSFCGLYHDYADHVRQFPEEVVRKKTDSVGAIKEVLINYIAIAGPVCKLFKRELIEENIFPKDLRVGEDVVAVVKVLKKCESAYFDTEPMYHYNHRDESAMSSDFSEKTLDLIYAYDEVGKILGDTLSTEVSFRQIWAHFFVLDKMLKSKSDDTAMRKEVISWIRKRFFKIIKNPYVGAKRKIALCGLMLHRGIYYFFIKGR